uniref:Uncharacterized protein n=1 Tax=Glossina brevipalpis TaxID=37001 RepID=A0A1A9WHN9_9MUSC
MLESVNALNSIDISIYWPLKERRKANDKTSQVFVWLSFKDNTDNFGNLINSYLLFTVFIYVWCVYTCKLITPIYDDDHNDDDDDDDDDDNNDDVVVVVMPRLAIISVFPVVYE